MKKNSKKQLLKYDLMVLQYIQHHIFIHSISQLIISYIQFKGIKKTNKQPFFNHDYVTPLLDGRIAYYCRVTWKVEIWNPETDIREIKLEHIIVSDIQLLQDGRLVITYYNKPIIIIVNPDNGNHEDGIGFTTSHIWKVKIINKDTIIIFMKNKNIHRWNITTGQYEFIDNIPIDIVSIDSLSEHKIVQISNSCRSRIDIVDLQTGKLKRSKDKHSDSINIIYVLPNGDIISTCSVENIIKIWNVDNDTGSIICRLTLIGHSDLISDVTILTDGRLVSYSYDRTIKIWNLETGICELTLDSGYKGSSSLTVLPDGGLLLSCFDFDEYIIWI